MAKGRTPLMIASILGEVEQVRALMAGSANLMAYDNEGFTALMHAVSNGNAQCVRILLQQSALEQVLALAKGRFADYKLTTIMIATINVHEECTRALLEVYPSEQLQMSDNKGITALMHAVCKHSVACVQHMLKYSPDLTVVTRSGATAMMFAIETGSTDCVRLLLAANSPLPTQPKLLLKMQPILADMAQQVLVPDMLNQAIAHSIGCMTQSKRRRTITVI